MNLRARQSLKIRVDETKLEKVESLIREDMEFRKAERETDRERQTDRQTEINLSRC